MPLLGGFALALACFAAAAAAAEDALPPRGAGAIEAVTGSLTVLQEDDFASGRTRRIYSLEDESTGQILSLDLPDELARGVRTGMRLRVRGVVEDGEMRLEEGAPHVEFLELSAAVTPGPRAAAILVVNFGDSPVSCTDSAIAGLMFTGARSVDGLYQEASFGAVSFPSDTDQNGQPDVFRVTIGASRLDSCNPDAWASAADAAAAGAGVTLSRYRHRLYVLPENSTCSWAGLAQVGCSTTCRAWVDTCALPDVYAHELGHNLGMGHASTDENDDGAIDCEYCDRSDFMGIGGVGWRQVNGPHKAQMAWLPQDRVVELAADGRSTVTLAPLEFAPAATPYPHVLRVVRPGSTTLQLSYRVQTGYDTTLLAAYAGRTSVHLHPGGGSSNTRFVTALADGQSFTDADADIVITQVRHDGGAVELEVEIGCSGGSACTSDPPPANVQNLHRTDIAP